MNEHGMYFAKEEFYQTIREIGGQWNDSKERPLVCLIKSLENDDIYWAIPVGNWNHRDEKAQDRITKYMNYDESDIRSCFYHVGKTDVKSIFFISDAVPIASKYIEREYIGRHTKSPYVIKNKNLLSELNRKLRRILSWENSNPNYFRQHISDIRTHLLMEIHNISSIN